MQLVQAIKQNLQSLVKNHKNLAAANIVDLHPKTARGRVRFYPPKQQSAQHATTTHVYLSV
jgi:hypothetical protein